MIIKYKNKKLERICRQPKQAIRHIGKNSANTLMRRLTDLKSAKNVRAVRLGKPHPLTGDRKGQMALRLNGKRLVFERSITEGTLKDDGTIDWHKVTEIIIVEITSVPTLKLKFYLTV